MPWCRWCGRRFCLICTPPMPETGWSEEYHYRKGLCPDCRWDEEHATEGEDIEEEERANQPESSQFQEKLAREEEADREQQMRRQQPQTEADATTDGDMRASDQRPCIPRTPKRMRNAPTTPPGIGAAAHGCARIDHARALQCRHRRRR